MDIDGQCADYDSILQICERHGVPVIEDAADALGATYNGQPAGTFGILGCFSFNGNKIIATSGGGMLVSPRSTAQQAAQAWQQQGGSFRAELPLRGRFAKGAKKTPWMRLFRRSATNPISQYLSDE